MKTLDIVKEYYDGVEKLVGKITMILYGSTVFGVQTSDLDLCFFTENIISNNDFEELKDFTRKFHIINNLRLDEEVPYENKLVYTYNFIEETLINSPFPICDGRYVIPRIKKNQAFLNSLEMRKRLLLNILTVKHMVMGDDKEKIDIYVDRAWEVILKTVISYAQKNNVSLDEILSFIYRDPFYGNEGEMYLGYKNNMSEKVTFIKKQVEFQLERLTKEDKLVKTLSNKYIPNEGWLGNENKY